MSPFSNHIPDIPAHKKSEHSATLNKNSEHSATLTKNSEHSTTLNTNSEHSATPHLIQIQNILLLA